jgi:hypothetical protein
MTEEGRHGTVHQRRRSGAALLIAMMMLALMGLVGMASLDTVMRDRQVAGYSSLSQSALYAADAGIAEGLDMLRQEITGLALTNGDCLQAKLLDKDLSARTLPNGAHYEDDPTSPTGQQICMLAAADPCPEVAGSLEQGQPIYLRTVWSVRVQGVAPGGATQQVMATAERCHAFNN